MKYYIQEEKVFAELTDTLLEWSPGTIAAGAMDPAIFQRIYKDEYRGAILQGYTPEQARMKAGAVATADFFGGLAASTALAGPENAGHATSVGTAGVSSPLTSGVAFGLNVYANSVAGDMAAGFVGNLFDKKYRKGRHHPDGKKKFEFKQHELDAVPYDDSMVGNFLTQNGLIDQDKLIQNFNDTVGMGNLLPKGKDFRQWAKDNGYPDWVGGMFDGNRTKEEEKYDATKQREDMGVKEAPGGGYVVDDEQFTADSAYGAESDEAYKKRMKEAQKLADRLNQQLIDKGFRPQGWKPQPLGSEVQQTNNNTPPVPSPQQPASEGPGPRVGPPPQNPGVTPPPDTPGTPGQPTPPPVPELPSPTTGPNAGQTGPGITLPAEPGQQPQAQNNGAQPQAQNNGAEQKPEQQAQPQADPGESEAQQQKNLTPMQQWAQKYPHLAQRLKPGQVGYDEVKDMQVVQNAKQPTAGGIERRTPGPLIKPDKTAQQNAAKVKQELQQARQNVDRAQQTQQRVATQNAQRAQDERTPTDPIMRAASKVRDAGQKYGDKAFSTTLRPQKGFEPLTKKKIGDPLGESLNGLMDYLLD